ncbi:NADPH:quinone oxidoreductase family protein [Flexibacterium corallicola]|uniref:NADPH:quinone oxidoreductase family protein n=1 Tax=Flexibacterium corallicola TaxID=3037259 RepID=UPI00286FA474|nr:NADPH:quinone oxidoreductase family protein [Pseudovibrio sp. M1P-2-3]
MKAIICKQYGPASDLVLEDLPEPELGPSQVRIKVKATALNFFDTLLVKGKYQYKPEPPFSPGGEFAGIVDEVGSEVSTVQKGDAVIAYMIWGAAQETLVVEADKLTLIPDGVNYDHAAGLMITYGTAIHGLRGRGDVKPCETVAVLGASGGAGLAAVEVAKAMGAHVIACASSQDKLKVAQEHGADELINYSDEDLKGTLKKLTNGKGVDVVYDAVGGDLAEPALRAMAWRGRYLVVGFASGDIQSFPANLTLLKGCDVRGVFWGRAIDEEPEEHKKDMLQLLDWLKSGSIRPRIHAVYSFEDFEKAFDEISSRRAKGKVILHPSSEV